MGGSQLSSAVVAADGQTSELGRWSPADTGEPFGDWELPGMGESASGCGEWQAYGFCDAELHLQLRPHACRRRECPQCWSKHWGGPRTVNVVSRLAGARHNATETAGKRCVHVAVSPPEPPNTIEAFYRMRTRANDIAKEHGIRGGVVVAHGYRPTKETLERFDESGTDLALWWWIRENDAPWKEQVYWYPHYHVIGLADPSSKDPDTGKPGHIEPGELERDDGWVFENIRSLDRFEGVTDKNGMEDMIRVCRYLLSHATFPANENRQSVTWFGALHGTNFSPKDELSPGAWSAIQRLAEELVGAGVDRDSGREGEEECSHEDCEGTVHDIWGARDYLEMSGHAHSREARDRLLVAYEYTTGQAKPPPGLCAPGTIDELEETLAHLLEEHPVYG